MAKANIHHIHSLEFNLGISSEENAKPIHDRISAFTEEKVPSILEQAMDRIDRPGTIISIDRLEIDLGDITLDALENHLTEIIPQHLDQLLKQPGDTNDRQSANVRIIPEFEDTIRQLEFFLLNGTLPWNAQYESFRDFDILIERLTEQSPKTFRVMLQRILSIETARRRLVFNLSPYTRELLSITFLGLPLNRLRGTQDILNWLHLHLKQRGIPVEEKRFDITALFPLEPGLLPKETARLLFQSLIPLSPTQSPEDLTIQMPLPSLPLPESVNLLEKWCQLEFSSPLSPYPPAQIQAGQAATVSPSSPPQGFPGNTAQWRIIVEYLFPEASIIPTSQKSPTDDSFPMNERDSSSLHPPPPQSKKPPTDESFLMHRPDSSRPHPFLRHSDSPPANENFPMLGHDSSHPLQPPRQPASPPVSSERNDAENRTEIIENKIDHLPVFIENSGLVILWTYLTRFFRTLKLVEGNEFISSRHRLQAIHELEFLVRDNEEYKEYHLILNKILCGLPLDIPVDTRYLVSPTDKNESELLLKAVIRNWKIIGNTSVPGFRQSFLQRDGKLTSQDNSRTLVIDRKGFDVLLEHLPYSIDIIKLPWMDKPLYVEW